MLLLKGNIFLLAVELCNSVPSPFLLCHETSSLRYLRKKTKQKSKHYIWGQTLPDKQNQEEKEH